MSGFCINHAGGEGDISKEMSLLSFFGVFFGAFFWGDECRSRFFSDGRNGFFQRGMERFFLVTGRNCFFLRRNPAGCARCEAGKTVQGRFLVACGSLGMTVSIGFIEGEQAGRAERGEVGRGNDRFSGLIPLARAFPP